MEIVYSVSSKATPSKLPSELQFEWVNFPKLNSIGPQHYALLEMDDQLGALDKVLDKKEEDPAELDSEFNAYGGYLHKLHDNRAKVGALSLRKHLGPWQFQEKLVDSHGNGATVRSHAKKSKEMIAPIAIALARAYFYANASTVRPRDALVSPRGGIGFSRPKLYLHLTPPHILNAPSHVPRARLVPLCECAPARVALGRNSATSVHPHDLACCT
ncbi:hypothetical protein PIB30_055610 [Stylosanthes scabra]|uniref:Uncharacterized protein n=1 Tax=Stylosanthes scabra TaxID=79078 RepID=A0ABU6XH18_9FABA|nr:hypothetical protein [Stylosanthes scabra]